MSGALLDAAHHKLQADVMPVRPCNLRCRSFASSMLISVIELRARGQGRKGPARVLNLTRPAVSQQLAILEQETGTVLFERSGRGVQLTLAGESLVARAGKVLELVSEIESDLASAKGSVTGEVRISAFGSVATTFIPAVFESLIREYPQLDLRFEELEPGESLKATT